ncbi:tripartite tricarboxylate transporter substrate binding protein [uncultured Pseudacidovorax sp.]|uniref:Bug family tripartite tricarboxylate transporter substrate binding protein n=1 Tax=uncultured Pseudacidovorax sp. TaxID=679313 RepID=UPI0025E370B0|nr:tripartite tricarboxylate transporter substrate-binding protein [uncultured Pseudacidovorax sp.]
MKKLFARTAALLCAAIACSAGAQDFPTKPLRMVVPFAPGGGADFVARAIAAPLAKRLGQPVVVDNKPGAGAVLGADIVAKAPADGHTLLYTTPGPQMTSPYLMARLPYDPVHDLVPVSEVAIVPNVLVVNKNLPVHSIEELIAYAKANPGKVNFASVATAKPSPLLPGVPPIAQTLKGFDAAPVNYISVPKKTPRAVIDRLNREINAVLASPELKEQFAANGVVPQGSTPEEMAALVRSEAAKWKKVIETSGARID